MKSFCRGVCLTLFLGLPAWADNPSPLFTSHERLEIRLSAPFSELKRSRGEDREYFPATLSYLDASDREADFELKVRTRGKSRSDPETCEFPPLLLNFKRKALAGTLLAGENRLKIVTHCRRGLAHNNYVLLEYLSYRALNLFSDASLRVRRVQVTYVESSRDREVADRPAFILEDIGRMADRLGMERVKSENVDWQQYDPASLNLYAVFQFFLGNTDWSIARAPSGDSCCHNGFALQRADGLLVPVPYDFDATGMVNAPYARPAEQLSIRTVRQRLYRGLCQSDELLQNTLEDFLARREALTELFASEPGLSNKARRSALAYIEDFYEIINEPQKRDRQIVARCREVQEE
ncbi:MAG: hypothetical protein ACR2QB_02095 [Gammaproteobacteria bacterium]